MKKVHYILSTALIAFTINASQKPFFNQKEKGFLKNLAIGYTTVGFSLQTIGNSLYEESRILETENLSNLSKLATIGRITGKVGDCLLSPITSMIKTVMLPITVPANYMTSKWVCTRSTGIIDPAVMEKINSDPTFKKWVPRAHTAKFALRTPAAAAIGFGIPLAVYKKLTPAKDE